MRFASFSLAVTIATETAISRLALNVIVSCFAFSPGWYWFSEIHHYSVLAIFTLRMGAQHPFFTPRVNLKSNV
jgi:hypothetical protein